MDPLTCPYQTRHPGTSPMYEIEDAPVGFLPTIHCSHCGSPITHLSLPIAFVPLALSLSSLPQ